MAARHAVGFNDAGCSMKNEPDLPELKRQLSPLLLRIPGVSGVGIHDGTLTVYLADESPLTKQPVEALIASHAPGVDVQYVVTGVFRAS
jgi:hypothetical protein